MTNGFDKSHTSERNSARFSKCAVCGADSDTTEYSLARDLANNSPVTLCPEHEQLFTILGQADSPTPARSIDENTQQTTKITVRLPRALLESADASAESQGQTRSDIVRDALQVYIELSEVDLAANELLSQAANQTEHTANQTDGSEVDVAFLKERIQKLESLLEDSIKKI
jgi:predicted DNA-binding protein